MSKHFFHTQNFAFKAEQSEDFYTDFLPRVTNMFAKFLRNSPYNSADDSTPTTTEDESKPEVTALSPVATAIAGNLTRTQKRRALRQRKAQEAAKIKSGKTEPVQQKAEQLRRRELQIKDSHLSLLERKNKFQLTVQEQTERNTMARLQNNEKDNYVRQQKLRVDVAKVETDVQQLNVRKMNLLGREQSAKSNASLQAAMTAFTSRPIRTPTERRYETTAVNVSVDKSVARRERAEHEYKTLCDTLYKDPNNIMADVRRRAVADQISRMGGSAGGGAVDWY